MSVTFAARASILSLFLSDVCCIVLRPEERAWLRKGDNTIAVEVPKAGGPNYFDLSLVEVLEPGPAKGDT